MFCGVDIAVYFVYEEEPGRRGWELYGLEAAVMTLGNYLRVAARVIGLPADAAMPMWARSTSPNDPRPEHSIKAIAELYIDLFYSKHDASLAFIL